MALDQYSSLLIAQLKFRGPLGNDSFSITLISMILLSLHSAHLIKFELSETCFFVLSSTEAAYCN